MEAAIREIRSGMSYRKAEAKYNIARSVLSRHMLKPDTRKHGGPPALGEELEALLVKRLQMCGDWGFPMDCMDLRLIVKGYLDQRGTTVRRFKNNMPGSEWAASFLRRDRQALAQRLCQNIKRSRAAVSGETINKYFDNLSSSIHGVPAKNIINYDETNLADDPGRKKVLMKRGTRYPERIMNQSKSATSVMYAGAADGTLLPPYIVYKATNLYDTWTFGGPAGARYNRSKSGWFDLTCFSDWFNKIIIPYIKKLTGRKLLIGDNLSSHLSEDVIAACEKYDIAFVFLPPNSTHLCQPLDVCFFRPMKAAWRPIVEKWKKGPGRKQSTIPKDTFPQLLKQLADAITTNAEANLKSGFAKCGICPLNRNKVLERLPETVSSTDAQGNASASASTSTDPGTATLDSSFRTLLHSMRYGESATTVKRRKKIDVEPGKSVTGVSHPDTNTSSNDGSDTDVEPDDNAESSSASEADDNEESSSASEPDDHEVSKCSYTGVAPVTVSAVQVNMWLVVNFSPGSEAAKGRKRKIYLGRVDKVLPVTDSNHAEFEAVFLRYKIGSNNCFVYPANEDRAVFTFQQVLGKTADPELQRRDVLKFSVVASEWK